MNTDPAFLDPDIVTRYLTARLPQFCGPLKITKFPTGQSNPTYRLDTPSKSYVLRRKPPGVLLKSAHAVDREYQVMTALRTSAVPVPVTHIMCDDETIIGTAFYVMDYVAGRTFVDPRATELGTDQSARAKLYDQMNEVLVAIHSVDVDAVGLSAFGKSGNYFARQIERWTRQYHDARTRENPQMDRLATWLEANTPPDDGRVSLVHGDYRIDNLLFQAHGTDVVAVLDWELSTLGHPFADLAYQCMQWRMPIDAPLQGLEGVDREMFGIPDEASYVARYCERMAIGEINNWSFYLAFSFFRLAAILEGVLKRAIVGNASNPAQAHRLGAMVPQLADRAIAIIA